MTPTKTCEACGAEFTKPYKRTWNEFAKRRFCSRVCSMKTVRQSGRTTRRTHCRSGRHEMTGDNVREGGGGRISCKACAAEKNREYKARTKGRPVQRRAARAKPASRPAPIPTVQVERPVWRPAGFTAEPNTGRAS